MHFDIPSQAFVVDTKNYNSCIIRCILFFNNYGQSVLQKKKKKDILIYSLTSGTWKYLFTYILTSKRFFSAFNFIILIDENVS